MEGVLFELIFAEIDIKLEYFRLIGSNCIFMLRLVSIFVLCYFSIIS